MKSMLTRPVRVIDRFSAVALGAAEVAPKAAAAATKRVMKRAIAVVC